MKKYTKEKMIAYAQTLPGCLVRAKCYNIASLKAGDSIADALIDEYRSRSEALRAAELMVEAGCAEEIPNKNPSLFGIFIFEDGSKLQ